METPFIFPLIPTRFKAKIAHTRSYPIGAEAISKALEGVQEFELFELTFWDYKFDPVAASYTVFSIRYVNLGSSHSASKEMIASGYHDPKWRIEIKAAPRTQRHAIQVELLERGLPFARQWLMQNIADGRRGRVGLSYFWIEEEQRLGYEVDEKLQPERI